MRRFVLVSAAVVLAFAFVGGSASAQTAPTVAVNPSTNLLSGQSVSVTGSDWPASASLAILECSIRSGTTGPLINCFGQQNVTTDSAGSFSASYAVVDDGCSSGATCLLGVSLADFSSPVLTTLTFAVPPKPDVVIRRRSDGVLFFDNVYTTTPGPYEHTIAPGGTWTFAVLVQNDGGAGDLTVHAGSVTSPFTMRYFIGYYDVTSVLTNGSGLTLSNMAPGASQLLAVQFTAAPAISPGATADTFVTASSPNSGLQDSIHLRVTASSP